MFKKAERKQATLKIAITGPSGSGKTYSALSIAKGLGKKIAVIDTENNSASLYSDQFEFDVLNLEPPFLTDKYIQAMNFAIQAGYDVLIIDSISHQWEGDGSLLTRKELMDAKGGNSFTNWAKFKPEQKKFKSAIVQADIHMICTMRSKQAYALEANDKGKQVPKKFGMEPIQEKEMEYEFTTVLDLDIKHYAKASKDRTGLFSTSDIDSFTPTEETGKKFMDWLLGAKPSKPKLQLWQMDIVKEKELYSLGELAGNNMTALDSRILKKFKKQHDALTEEEFNMICDALKKEAKELELK